jgi:hypothetical protein
MYEKTLERYVCDKIKAVGGRAFKWVCPGLTGAPDRIAVFPGGMIVFIELKRPGRKDGLSEKQKKVCRVLESLGCNVRRIGSKGDFKEFMKEIEVRANEV